MNERSKGYYKLYTRMAITPKVDIHRILVLHVNLLNENTVQYTVYIIPTFKIVHFYCFVVRPHHRR